MILRFAQRLRAYWLAALVALLGGTLAPTRADASLPGASDLSRVTDRALGADTREIQVTPPVPCHGPFCAGAQ